MEIKFCLTVSLSLGDGPFNTGIMVSEHQTDIEHGIRMSAVADVLREILKFGLVFLALA